MYYILSPMEKGGGLHRLCLKSIYGLELKLHEVHLAVKFSKAELSTETDTSFFEVYFNLPLDHTSTSEVLKK